MEIETKAVGIQPKKDFWRYKSHILGGDGPYSFSGSADGVAERIQKKLEAMIRSEFNAISILNWNPTRFDIFVTTGPDRMVCDQIDQWIKKNWYKAVW